MRIIKTDCTPEEVQQDMPELKRLNAEAMETEFMWEFFGGTITLENGHKYQVTGEQTCKSILNSQKIYETVVP